MSIFTIFFIFQSLFSAVTALLKTGKGKNWLNNSFRAIWINGIINDKVQSDLLRNKLGFGGNCSL
jgi:hypothetical protein